MAKAAESTAMYTIKVSTICSPQGMGGKIALGT